MVLILPLLFGAAKILGGAALKGGSLLGKGALAGGALAGKGALAGARALPGAGLFQGTQVATPGFASSGPSLTAPSAFQSGLSQLQQLGGNLGSGARDLGFQLGQRLGFLEQPSTSPLGGLMPAERLPLGEASTRLGESITPPSGLERLAQGFANVGGGQSQNNQGGGQQVAVPAPGPVIGGGGASIGASNAPVPATGAEGFGGAGTQLAPLLPQPQPEQSNEERLNLARSLAERLLFGGGGGGGF